MRRFASVIGAGILLAMVSATPGQTIRVIYSEIADDPTGLVPVGADVPPGTRFDAFDRPYPSPDGLSWILSASTNLSAGQDEVIIVGADLSGVTVVREGTVFGSPTSGELCGLIDRNLAISDTGEYLFTMNSDGPTTADEYVVLFDGVGWVAAAREGDPVPSMPTEAIGSILNSPSLILDGLGVAYRAPSTVGLLGSGEDDFLIRLAAPLAQSGFDIPLGQIGGGVEQWEVFDANDYYVSADGAVSLAQGDLTGATSSDDVVVVDGTVVAQENGFVVNTGLVSPIETIVESLMNVNGRWFVRGDNDDQKDWVIGNHALLGRHGEPIVLGGGEMFADPSFAPTFFWMGGDSFGNTIIGGTTDNPDSGRDAVLVLNRTTVVAREGDPVDLDGDGANNDGIFIESFDNDDGFLTDAGILYFTAVLADDVGTEVGQAFLSYDISRVTSCAGDIAPELGDGMIDIADLLILLAAWGPCPEGCEISCLGDLTGNCNVGIEDLLQLLAGWGEC